MMKKVAPPKKDIKVPQDPSTRKPAPPPRLSRPMPMPGSKPMPGRGISRPMPVGGPGNMRSIAPSPSPAAPGGVSRPMPIGGGPAPRMRMQKGGKTKMATGGRIDGCAMRGLTRA